MRIRIAAITAYLSLVALTGYTVWWFALGAALTQLSERGQADLQLASDRLVSELQSYRELAVLLADHPTLVPLVTGDNGDMEGAERMLLRAADMTGALEIMLLDRAGNVVAQSNPFASPGPRNMGDTAYFKRASKAVLGFMHWQFGNGTQRAFTFAAPVFGLDRKPAGAVAVSVNLDVIEASWRAAPQVVFFADEAGVVFISNRSEMLYRTRGSDRSSEPATIAPENQRQYQEFSVVRRAGFETWGQDSSPYLPARALHLNMPLPLMNMWGEVLVDSAEAEQLALFQGLVAGGLGLIFGGLILFFTERRRGILQRLSLEAAANAQLEARVRDRTEALQQAQQELVQAGKLSALGQMSAGISHELNQPLMAIRSYAENAQEFLRRGKAEVADDNLAKISDLARRMGRIIKNLRAFTRQETEPLGRVELGGVIRATLDLSQVRLRDAQVALHTDLPAGPVYVHGGEVRLQQVLLNLVGNALDAMEGQAEKRLTLTVTKGERVLLSVRDTGPGLSDPDKIFDPFYTTKEVGRSEGMGLGLSISYGIVQSFGGVIQGRNHPDGGAIVTVELPPAPAMEQAA
jgi:two-component system C4-dicarboxylate transport sensor histidine kinase DctB